MHGRERSRKWTQLRIEALGLATGEDYRTLRGEFNSFLGFCALEEREGFVLPGFRVAVKEEKGTSHLYAVPVPGKYQVILLVFAYFLLSTYTRSHARKYRSSVAVFLYEFFPTLT